MAEGRAGEAGAVERAPDRGGALAVNIHFHTLS